MKSLSRVRLFATPWTVAYQPPLSMGFSRQEYWSGVPFPFPRDLPNPGIAPMTPALAGGIFIIEPPGKPLHLRDILTQSKSDRVWFSRELGLFAWEDGGVIA